MSQGPRAEQTGPDGVEIAPGVVVAPDALSYTYARSGGPGGQNVNTRSTKAQLRIALDDRPITRAARGRLVRLAGSLVTGKDELLIASEEHRTQRRNREACLERLRALLVEAIPEPKRRKKTRPSRGAIERRLKEKRVRSDTKARRRRTED